MKIFAHNLPTPSINKKAKALLKTQKKIVVQTKDSTPDSILVGLKKGKFIIDGNAGDYLGALNFGAEILVKGNVGRFVGNNMTSGLIIVEGSADYGAGSYIQGGNLVVKKSAGPNLGQMAKGGNIIVAKTGDNLGLYMFGGNIITNKAGQLVGHHIISGNIFVKDYESLGENAEEKELTQEDRNFLKKILKAKIGKFKKIGSKELCPFSAHLRGKKND
jgi:glutamate synthase domain-containing protein 3